MSHVFCGLLICCGSVAFGRSWYIALAFTPVTGGFASTGYTVVVCWFWLLLLVLSLLLQPRMVRLLLLLLFTGVKHRSLSGAAVLHVAAAAHLLLACPRVVFHRRVLHVSHFLSF